MATPPTFVDGTVVPAASLTFLAAQPRAAAFRNTGGTSLADDVMTVLTLDTKSYDTDSMWSAGSPTRLTVKTAGLWLIHAYVRVPTAVYGRLSLNPRINAGGVAGSGSSIVTYHARNVTMSGTPTANTGLSARVTLEVELAVNDYVEVFVQQKSGATRTTDSGENVTGLSMRRVADTA